MDHFETRLSSVGVGLYSGLSARVLSLRNSCLMTIIFRDKGLDINFYSFS